MTEPRLETSERVVYLALALAVALIALNWPLIVRLDDGTDRERRVFQAREEMLKLQVERLKRGGEVEPVIVRDGATVQVGAKSFTAPTSITVEVTEDDRGRACVRAENESGDETGLSCRSKNDRNE